MRDIPLLAEEGAKREPDRAKPQERMRRAKRRRRRVVRPADHVIAELTTPALSRHPSSARRGILHEQHGRILNQLRLPDPHDQDHPDLWRSHGRACIPDLDRTEGYGASPDAAWSDTRRTIWASSADCRRPEISFQRRCYPGECQQVSICSRTCRVANSCVAVFFRYPFWSLVTSNGSQCRAALCLRDHVAWGVRHCAWRMGIEFEVSVDGRNAIVSSNDQL